MTTDIAKEPTTEEEVQETPIHDTSIQSVLAQIQTELKAPKGQMNDFGKYKYRSCEDILEGLKPHLKKHSCHVILKDKIVVLADRFYIKAKAAIINERGDKVTSTAYAREPIAKKGMDDSQVTGAASSYARKYALNGLFCIDDTKDADTMDNSKSNGTAKLPDFNPQHPKWLGAINSLRKGEVTIDKIKTKYTLTLENENKLKKELQNATV